MYMSIATSSMQEARFHHLCTVTTVSLPAWRMEGFFVVKVAPGKHVFRSNDKQAGVEIDLKNGQDYYIRLELATGFMKGHGRLVLVAPEQDSYEIKKLKPLGTDKVKDTEHVVPQAS